MPRHKSLNTWSWHSSGRGQLFKEVNEQNIQHFNYTSVKTRCKYTHIYSHTECYVELKC